VGFLQKYKMTEKPKGKLQDKVDIAVDSIVQLSIGTIHSRLNEARRICMDKSDQLVQLLSTCNLDIL
jgi:hypothetical protein